MHPASTTRRANSITFGRDARNLRDHDDRRTRPQPVVAMDHAIVGERVGVEVRKQVGHAPPAPPGCLRAAIDAEPSTSCSRSCRSLASARTDRNTRPTAVPHRYYSRMIFDAELGPVTHLVVSFQVTPSRPRVWALRALDESGRIDILDLEPVIKDEDGTVRWVEASDVGAEAFAASASERSTVRMSPRSARRWKPGSVAIILIWRTVP